MKPARGGEAPTRYAAHLVWLVAGLLLAIECPVAAAELPQQHVVLTEDDAELPPLSQEYFTEQHDGFRIAYHPAARERVRDLITSLASLRDELARALGKPLVREVELRVAELPVELEQLAPPHEPAIASHGGLCFPARGLIVVSLGGAERDGESFEASLRHHLAHLALHEASLDASGASQVPAWFAEGFAVHFASTQRVDRVLELGKATWSGDPPSLSELSHATGASARERAFAADFARFTLSEGAMPALFGGLRDGLDFERAVESAFGSEPSTIDRAWRRDVTRRYAIFPTIALCAGALAALLVLRAWRRRRRAALVRSSRGVVSLRGVRGARAARHAMRRREARVRIPIHLADHRELPVVEHDGTWHTLH